MDKDSCENLASCPFFKAAKNNVDIFDILNEYVNVYCRGPFKDQCYRVAFYSKYGISPGDSISPSGLDFNKYV